MKTDSSASSGAPKPSGSTHLRAYNITTMKATSSASSDAPMPFRLLELPPELRLMIFEAHYTNDFLKTSIQQRNRRKQLRAEKFELADYWTEFDEALLVSVEALPSCREMGSLLAASRAVFDEALPIYRERMREIWADTIREHDNILTQLAGRGQKYKVVGEEAQRMWEKASEILGLQIAAKKQLKFCDRVKEAISSKEDLAEQ